MSGGASLQVMDTPRLSYEISCTKLQPTYLDSGPPPPLPIGVPQYDDPEPLGVAFFRMLVEGKTFTTLTLPRTFFGRSEIRRVSFEDTNLSESNLCWNDFINVDFSRASLARADMRASSFVDVNFTSTHLEWADLRRSSFEGCIFEGACMTGTILTITQGENLTLSKTQRAEIAWAESDGEEPGGG